MNHATLILTALLVSSITYPGVTFPRVAAAPRVNRDANVERPVQTEGQHDAMVKKASTELKTGRSRLRSGDSAQALIHLDRALELFRQAQNRRGEAASHDLLGELYERQGNYEAALAHFNQAHEIFAGPRSPKDKKPLSPYDADLMHAKIGQMNYRLGDMDEAKKRFEAMSDKKPSMKKSLISKVTKTATKMATDDETIENVITAADATFSVNEEYKSYRQSIVYSARELGLGRIAYFRDQPQEAKKHFENVLKVTKGSIATLGKFGQTRRFRAAAHTALGDLALHRLDYKKAASLYTQAIKEATNDQRLDLTWPAERGYSRALWLLASGEKNQKKVEKYRNDALAGYRRALKIIATLREGSLRADEARTTFLASTSDVFVEAAAMMAELALASEGAQTGTPLKGTALDLAAEALAIVEAGRARSLLDLLRETGSSVNAGVPPDLLLFKQNNLNLQEEIAAKINGTDSSGDEPKKGSLDKMEARLNQLQAEYDRNENKIRQLSWRYESLTSPPTLTLATIRQQVLDPGTVLLAYSLGEKYSYLWLVTREEVRLFKLPARSVLSGEVEEMRKQMIPERVNTSIFELTDSNTADQRGLILSRRSALGNPQPFAAASHALYRSVLAQAAPFVGTKRLLVVGDGALNYVPFEALVTDAKVTNYTNLSYLIQRNEVVYAPSASVIAAIRSHASVPASDSILLIADPVFDLSDPRAATLARTPSTQPDPRASGLNVAAKDVEGKQLGSALLRSAKIRRIPATGSEADEIAKYAGEVKLKPQVWRDLAANETNVSGDLSRYRVLHFATHGLLNSERPQFSGLVLSLVGNADGKDGFLRTDEVFNLKLGSPLVMLSACQSGLGKEKRGEGVIGLTRAFLYAGAPTVGVTLWSVDDQPTAKLMAAFYKKYLTEQGTTPSTAMRAAQQAMIADKEYATPYHWAAFILVGDY